MLSLQDSLRCYIIKCMAVDKDIIDYSRININDLSNDEVGELIEIYKKELLFRCKGDMELVNSLSRVYVYGYVKKYTDNKKEVYSMFSKNDYSLDYIELYMYENVIREYAVINKLEYKDVVCIENHIYKTHVNKIYN